MSLYRYTLFYTAANVHSTAKQLLRIIYTSLAHRKSFHVKPSQRCIPAKVFMLGRMGTNEFQISDVEITAAPLWSLKTGQGCFHVEHSSKPTPRGCDVMKAGTVARPRGGGHPEGVRNATRSPQIEHSRQRQQTLIATTLCADFNYLATNPSLG